jgi:multidrug efflux pump subunit AcrB
MMIVGIGLLPLLTLQLHPSAPAHNLSISYSWPQTSARIVEQEVTSVLEGLFNRVKGIESISSVSSPGYGRINLSFKKNVNRDAIRFEIASLIRQSYPQFPTGVSYPQLSMDISGERSYPVMVYTINGNSSPYYIKKYAEHSILPLLSKIKGISNLEVYGATPYIIEIEFHRQKAQELGISGSDIAQAINTCFNKEFIGKGTFTQFGADYVKEISLHVEQNMYDTVQWERIPIRKMQDRILYLTDLATVSYKEQVPTSYYRINGLNTINLVIYPEKDVNIIALAQVIHEKINGIKQNLQPGYSILLASDSTEYLSKEIDKIIFRSAVSLGILIILILIISRSIKYLAVVMLGIIVTLLITCILFYLFKIELQFYSLAGVTVSLGVMAGNSIIMITHVRSSGNQKIFLAIFASTLVTIASLCVIFFLPPEQKTNLIEFALVIVINLMVSFVVVFYFIPALLNRVTVNVTKKINYRSRKKKFRLIVFYGKVIAFNKRIKWVYITLLVFGFGLPVYLLPDEIKGIDGFAVLYNKTIGDISFKGNVRPTLEKIAGGTLRLFAKDIVATSYHSEPSKTVLHVRASMPEGCTVHQLNETVEAMENFISQFDEVELFQTTVSGYKNSDISIYFKPSHELTHFPYFLKSLLEEKAINLGGADWSVVGVGQGFSNALNTEYKSCRIELHGYNYEQLYQYAELLRSNLLKNPRIREVDISGEERWSTDAVDEFFIDFNAEQLALNGLSTRDFYGALHDNNYQSWVRPMYINHQQYMVNLKADTYGSFTRWNFDHDPLEINGKLFKLKQFGTIEKRKSGNNIYKFNQQYKLVVAYDFIGSYELSEMIEEQHIESMKNELPLGYSVKSDRFSGWDKDSQTQYYYILLAIAVIYVICTILFESLLQPLAVIMMIPISFIGVFITFYLFHINFDQGGYACFILLSGLAVNAGLYIVNDFNNFRMQKPGKKIHFYHKAFYNKITPVVMSMISVAVGLVSFIIEGQREVFWFAFSAGIIGGLLFSIIGILIYLPLFLPLSNKNQYPHVSKQS